jgi:hypothetical protein
MQSASAIRAKTNRPKEAEMKCIAGSVWLIGLAAVLVAGCGGPTQQSDGSSAKVNE